MTRRYEEYRSPGQHNSLWYWARTVAPYRVVINFLVIATARYLPWLPLKNALYRRIGMTVGKRVSVGLEATFDIFFPELISIGDNSIIGFNTAILGHEYLIKTWRKGKVEIGSNVVIGANCTVLPGIRIGDGAVVSAHSLVNRDIPAGAFYGGVPARRLKRVDNDVSAPR